MKLHCARAFIERCAGGHYVVDQKQSLSAEIGRAVKSAADVLLAFAPGQVGLCGRIAGAAATRGIDRDAQCLAQRAGEFERLIEAAFA